MAAFVLTVIGDDQSGLVDALSGVVADHGGNWDKSHMARLAGKFAGIVMVSVPDRRADEFLRDLEPLGARGLLEITAERADLDKADSPTNTLSLDIMGLDHPGIVHDISHALATRNVSIEELRTETTSAPMGGGTLFVATALLRVPADVATSELVVSLEELANELVVDIEVTEAPDG